MAATKASGSMGSRASARMRVDSSRSPKHACMPHVAVAASARLRRAWGDRRGQGIVLQRVCERSSCSGNAVWLQNDSSSCEGWDGSCTAERGFVGFSQPARMSFDLSLATVFDFRLLACNCSHFSVGLSLCHTLALVWCHSAWPCVLDEGSRVWALSPIDATALQHTVLLYNVLTQLSPLSPSIAVRRPFGPPPAFSAHLRSLSFNPRSTRAADTWLGLPFVQVSSSCSRLAYDTLADYQSPSTRVQPIPRRRPIELAQLAV